MATIYIDTCDGEKCRNCYREVRGLTIHSLLINKYNYTTNKNDKYVYEDWICRKCRNPYKNSKFSRGLHNVEAHFYITHKKMLDTYIVDCDGYDTETGEGYWL